MLVEGLGHDVEAARDGLEGLAKLQLGVDLVLLDVVMPGLDGFDVCRRIRQDPAGKDVPVIMVTTLETREHRLHAVEAGANDFIAKPVDETELRVRTTSLLKMKAAQDEVKRYQAHLETMCEERTVSLRKALEHMAEAQRMAYQAQLETVERLAILAEYKDKVTGRHIQRMSEYSAVIARGLNLPPSEVELILHASRMHDVGKIAVPEAILRKPAELDPHEWKVMRQHSMIGSRILENSSSQILQAGRVIALNHHERWDGRRVSRGSCGQRHPAVGPHLRGGRRVRCRDERAALQACLPERRSAAGYCATARASTSTRASLTCSSNAWKTSWRYRTSTKTKTEGRMLSRREALIRIGSAAGVAAIHPPAWQRADRAALDGARARKGRSAERHLESAARFFDSRSRIPIPTSSRTIPSFNALRVGNTPIQRLWTGGMWCEGPAWNGQGQYLIWSDIPNNRQMRWIEDDGRVTVFRQPSGNSNGNTFDHQGRQLSCEHSGRRVVRYEHDGSITVIADSFQGKRLNSPNDIACHPDGSYWFTDPPYGGQLYEGMPDAAGGPSNQEGRLNAKVGQPAGSGVLKRELSCNVYRVDPSGRIDMVISEEALGAIPNGITFSPDYKRLYVVNRGLVSVLDVVGPAHQVSKPRQFADFMVDGIPCRTDGIRADVFGNLWASSNAGANRGLQRRDGVEPGGEADRPHPSAGGVCQRRVRRPEAKPSLHGRRAVALCGLHEYAGIVAGIKRCPRKTLEPDSRRNSVEDMRRCY